MRLYTCVVCGYDELKAPPSNYTICPCCGTEFGYNNFATPNEELRKRWIEKGMEWWSPTDVPPKNWNAQQQLERAGLAPN